MTIRFLGKKQEAKSDFTPCLFGKLFTAFNFGAFFVSLPSYLPAVTEPPACCPNKLQNERLQAQPAVTGTQTDAL
ncbi:MAG: hypothetical protein ACI4J0_10790 [Huintestinicola sp.]|uniref:hypothetical protein n=1 Tax=Huintestinicola sp. TaxID=2981661 RepID=UPI003F10E0EB